MTKRKEDEKKESKKKKSHFFVLEKNPNLRQLGRSIIRLVSEQKRFADRELSPPQS